MNNTMQVYYGQDFLPYKDSARQVHYPIVSRIGGGSLIVGENNTTTLRFYTTYIGGNTNYWVVDIKLPNGQIVYKLLGQGLQDNDTGEWYVDLSISDLYTTIRGEIFVSLKGYSGEISFEEEDDNYFLNGNPTILATGVVKIMVNYAPQVLYRGGEIEHTELEQIIADLTNKLDIDSGIVVIDNIFTFVSSSDYANYEVGQVFLSLYGKAVLVRKTNTSPYYEILDTAYVHKTTTTNIVYGTDNSGNQTTIPYSVAATGSGTLVMRATDGNVIVPSTPTDDSFATSKVYVDTNDKYIFPMTGSSMNLTDDQYNLLVGNNNIQIAYTYSGNNLLFSKIRINSSNQDLYRSNYRINEYVGSGAGQYTNEKYAYIILDRTNKRLSAGADQRQIYNKTQADNYFATKSELETLKANAFIKVDTTTYTSLASFLSSTGVEGYIYLYPIDLNDLTKGYYQYIWESSAWLSIGTTQIDLSDYVQKTQTIAGITLANNISAQDLTNALVFASNDDIDGLFA